MAHPRCVAGSVRVALPTRARVDGCACISTIARLLTTHAPLRDGYVHGAWQADIMPVVEQMQALRAQLALYANQDTGNKLQIDSTALEDLLRRRMFVVPAFEVRCGRWLGVACCARCRRTLARACAAQALRGDRAAAARRATRVPRSTMGPPACSTSAPRAVR